MNAVTGTALRLVSADDRRLGHLIDEAAPDWFRSFHLGDTAAEAAVLAGQIAAAKRANGRLVAAEDVQGCLIGAAAFTPSPWDSDWFGLDMGRISPMVVSRALDGAARRQVVEFLLHALRDQVESDGGAILVRRVLAEREWEREALEKQGFLHVDTLATMTAATRPGRETVADLKLRELVSDDLEDALSLLPGQFPLSRFCVDPRLATRGEGVYSNWLKNALAPGRQAFGIAAVAPNGRLAGFTLWSELDDPYNVMTQRIGSLDLFVVGSSYRSRGVGSALLDATLSAMSSAGQTICEASTWVENEAALAAYRRAGFVERARLLSYHS